MSAPAPLNLAAMADAWDNPYAFAAQVQTYYAQLEQSGDRVVADDRTTANRSPGAA